MSKMVAKCPACEDRLVISRLSCPSCRVQLDGQFEIPSLLRLSPDDLRFVINFIKVSGSLKEMAKIEGLSYPTIRTRLNDLIGKLDADIDALEMSQHEILDAVAEGTLSAAEGAGKLKELKK